MDRGRGISIVIPVLNDVEATRQILRQIASDSSVEVIVVDGGTDQRLDEVVAGRNGTRLLRAAPGRAGQMNAGAREASEEWILFLHADSQLPDRWRETVTALPETVVGGWFRFAIDDRAWQARVIERLVAWRVRALTLPYGDQGLLVRRTVFNRLGGFHELVFLEDVEFVRRLAGAGPVAELPLPLRTSARRWRRDGWFRRSARNSMIVALYFAGVSPARLARWYQ